MNKYGNDILNLVSQNLVSDVKLDWKSEEKNTKDTGLDGILNLTWKNKTLIFQMIIKNEIRLTQLNQLIDYQKDKNIILIANKIYPKVKEKLRAINIAYLEGNGSLFISKKNTQIWIETNKTVQTIKPKTNRAFTKTGLKVVFHFLIDKNLINKTHREISAKTGVSLGSISWVIYGLKEMGFLLKLDKKTFLWENRESLLRNWLSAYQAILRPNLVRGKYTLRNKWQDINLNTKLTVWGGEPAGDLLTNYLRPEKFILYSQESNIELMKNYQLFPHPDGEVEVLEKFWQESDNQNYTFPILTYVDLMIENEKRCEETAQKIYEKYIKSNL